MKIKRIVLIAAAILMLVPIVVYALGEMKIAKDAAVTDSTEESVFGKRFDFKYEPDRKDLPNSGAAQKIVEGMSVSEVYAILGNPQRDTGSGTAVLEWNLDSGEVLVVSFGLHLEMDDWIVIQTTIS